VRCIKYKRSKVMLFFFILFEFQATTGMIITLKATEKCSTCPLILRYVHWKCCYDFKTTLDRHVEFDCWMYLVLSIL